jgi:heme/copper-type cytochrome/quinol oxidase subunit 4
MKTGIERLQEQNKKKKRLSDLDKYVIFSFTNVIIFTIVAVVYQFVTGGELSSTLITCFFSLFGGELLMLCMIKRLKLKKGDNDERPYI